MSRAEVLMPWVVEALRELGGKGSVVDVSKVVWRRHETDLERLGDLFYTWQYDLRWAAQRLRATGVLRPATTRNAPWEIAGEGDR